MDHIVIARRLEVGHHDVACIVFSSSAGLAHQTSRPQAQHLVLAGARLELQFHLVLELVFKGFFTFVETCHRAPLRWPVPLRIVEATRPAPFHPPLPISKLHASTPNGATM